MFYVDDGMVAAKNTNEAEDLVQLVASLFATRALGEPVDFLGIHICRDRSAGTISIDQEDKARALAAELEMESSFRAHDIHSYIHSVPMTSVVYQGLKAAKIGEPMADKQLYQQTIGSLLHLAQCTRPDIALPVGALAAYCSKPSAVHWARLLDVVRYVGGTASRGITFGNHSQALGIWCDANFASCLDTRRSTTGWVVVMYGSAVSWASKKQPTAAASTMDAEYQACGSVAREGLSLAKALRELEPLSTNLPLKDPMIICYDNKAAQSLCQDHKEGSANKAH
jgi:hypothetical protein